eukprot:1148128-Amphidinium_carterae.1
MNSPLYARATAGSSQLATGLRQKFLWTQRWRGEVRSPARARDTCGGAALALPHYSPIKTLSA